jgi:hypothetical protein
VTEVTETTEDTPAEETASTETAPVEQTERKYNGKKKKNRH